MSETIDTTATAPQAAVAEDEDIREFERQRDEYFNPTKPVKALFDEIEEEEQPAEGDAQATEDAEPPETGMDPTGTAGDVPPDDPAPATVPSPDGAPKPPAPLMVLKVNGQNVPIFDYQDAITLAQKGFHYTQEMQQLAQFREVLSGLGQHQDLREELLKRMRGGVPAKAPDAPKEKESEIEIPEMGETETHAEWMKRVMRETVPKMAEQIAARKAAEIVGHATTEMEETQKRDRLMSAVKADPMYNATIAVLRQTIETGQVPDTLLAMADRDPKTFVWLYDGARRKALAMQTQPQPPKPQQKPATVQVPAPHAESAGGRGASRAPGKKTDLEVLDDMGRDDFRTLTEKIKAGMVS